MGMAGLDLGEVQDLVDQSRESLRLTDQDAEEAAALLDIDVGLVI
jgi:hypothetical protein